MPPLVLPDCDGVWTSHLCSNLSHQEEQEMKGPDKNSASTSGRPNHVPGSEVSLEWEPMQWMTLWAGKEISATHSAFLAYVELKDTGSTEKPWRKWTQKEQEASQNNMCPACPDRIAAQQSIQKYIVVFHRDWTVWRKKRGIRNLWIFMCTYWWCTRSSWILMSQDPLALAQVAIQWLEASSGI